MATDSFARSLGFAAIDKVDNLPTAFKVKPAVATYADLPSTGNQAGDVRETLDTNIEYYWDGTAWKQYGQDNAVSYNAQTGKTALEKAQARANINAQEVLPDAVAGRYLHANDSTGTLEWSEVASGGGSLFRHQITMTKRGTTEGDAGYYRAYFTVYTNSATSITTISELANIIQSGNSRYGAHGLYYSTSSIIYPIVDIDGSIQGSNTNIHYYNTTTNSFSSVDYSSKGYLFDNVIQII